MVKVLVANDLYGRSSAAGVAVRMAEGLAARGHEVSFVATVQKPDRARRATLDGVDVHEVFTPAYAQRWRAWRSLDNPPAVAALAGVVAALKPDVVHVHNLHMHLSYAALAAVKARGAATVLTVHDVMPFCHQKLFCHLDERLHPGDEIHYEAGLLKCAVCVKGRWNPRRNSTIRDVFHRDVDRLVAVSSEMARALAENGLGDAAVIHNGAQEDVPAASAADVEALRSKLGLAGRRVVLFGGRLDRLKGGLELVRAFELLVRAAPDAVLLTVGEALPGFREEIESLAARLGLDPARHLVHAGWLTGSELAASWALADVVATPSLCFESFGLVNLEAMQAGTPVVASCWGGPMDVVEDGVSGFLVNPLHVDVLADRLRRVLCEPGLAAKLGAAAAARARDVFGLSRQLDRTEALYAEMMS